MADVPASVKDRHGWLELKLVDEQGSDLTQWEIDFVESLTSQLLGGGRLSPKQVARLEQIKEDRVR